MPLKRNTLLIYLMFFSLLYNSLLQWIPFTPGRSQNDLISLESNLMTIFINLFIYSLFFVILFFARSDSKLILGHSKILYFYILYIISQSFFRGNIAIEFVRALGFAVMFISADWLGKYLGSNIKQAEVFFINVWKMLIFTTTFGLLIGLILPGSVNWGGGLSLDFVSDRAEFFFFSLSPVVLFSLSLWIIKRNQLPYKITGYIFALLCLIMALRTETRSTLMSFGVVIFFILYANNKSSMKRVVFAIAFLFLFGLSELSSFSIIRRFADFDNFNSFTTGRFDLFLIIINSYLDSPIFGQGAEKMRQIIWAGDSLGKTEHGYIVHLGSFGVFSILFYIYILFGLLSSIYILTNKASIKSDVRGNYYFVLVCAALAFSWCILGFVGVFGSGSAFYDWFALFNVSLCYSLRKNYFADCFRVS